ncbi:MAG: response regulator transcription factor [Bacteroidales bacterium]|nr:response regulator transcription factor [Bacteroidales bacterium]
MNVLIIEDEAAIARRMQKLLLEIDPAITVIETLGSVETSVAWFKSHTEPDLAIMDIQLADGSSFEIFGEVQINCPVIFATAYDQYAIQAFKVNSIDYLLKPVQKEELAESLKKFKRLQTPSGPQGLDYSVIAQILGAKKADYLKRLVIRFGDVIKAVEVKDVAYFYTDEKIVYATLTEGKTYPIDFTLDQLEKKLDPERFFRINRKFLISYESITKMISYSKSRVKITLAPVTELEVISSTERSGDFKEWLAGK